MAGCTKLGTTAMSIQPSSNPDDPLTGLRRIFNEAALRGDVDTLATFATDDTVLMSPNDTTVYGRAEWKAWWEEYYQYFRIVALSEPDRSVTVVGEFATEISGYMLAI